MINDYETQNEIPYAMDKKMKDTLALRKSCANHK